MSRFVTDTLVIAKRNILRIRRTPRLLVFSSTQPIMFVLLFRYVFGGSIQPPGYMNRYADFLLPGIMIQLTLFGGGATSVGLAEDFSKGDGQGRRDGSGGEPPADLPSGVRGLDLHRDRDDARLAAGLRQGEPGDQRRQRRESARPGLRTGAPFPGAARIGGPGPGSVMPGFDPKATLRTLETQANAGRYVVITLLWCAAIIAVFGGLAVRRYRKG